MLAEERWREKKRGERYEVCSPAEGGGWTVDGGEWSMNGECGGERRD